MSSNKSKNDGLYLVYSSEWEYEGKIDKPIKYQDITITDFKLHAQTPYNPAPVTRQMEKSIRSKRPGRAYTADIKKDGKGVAEISFDFTSHIKQQVKNIQEEGKVLRVWAPKSGVRIDLGDDAIEYLNAHPELQKHLTK